MAAISHYFTTNRAAKILGEDEEWLQKLSINMFAAEYPKYHQVTPTSLTH
jgi:hypothetical protein